MRIKEVSWAEAEELFPGCSIEWDVMIHERWPLSPEDPAMDYRMELREWPVNPDANGEATGHRWVLHVISTEPGWLLSPEWRRWPSGNWTFLQSLNDGRFIAPGSRRD